MEILLVILVLVFVLLLLLKPNMFLSKAVCEWPSLSQFEKFVYVSLLWLLPGVGHYIAYKKSGLDRSLNSIGGGSSSGGSGTDSGGGTGGGCGDGGC